LGGAGGRGPAEASAAAARPGRDTRLGLWRAAFAGGSGDAAGSRVRWRAAAISPAPTVIAISGPACILAGLGGLVSPSLGQLQRGSPLCSGRA
jgi:hypothetical protein